jgi:uncharacterized protein YfaP (DUF2135 family)
MDCWPTCSPFCECVGGTCQPRLVTVNALRLRTRDGRYLHAAPTGWRRLVAANVSPGANETFLFTPARWPIQSGDTVSLELTGPTFAASGQLVRVDHNPIVLVSGSGKERRRLDSYEIGGPGTGIYVRGPWDAGYAAYPGDTPEERSFDLIKVGGGAIGHGDEISLLINSNWGKTFFFRLTGPGDQATVDADGLSAGLPETVFVVELNEVQPNAGWRPPTVDCQACAVVNGLVTDRASGLPIAGAGVRTRGVLEDHPFDATTAGDGRFTLHDPEGRDCIPLGDIEIVASADRHQTGVVTVTVPDAGTIDVSVKLECTRVQGWVLDVNHNFAPGVAVFLSDPMGRPILDPQGHLFATTTLDDGSFAFDCPQHGAAVVWTDVDLTARASVTIPPEGLSNVILILQQATCGNAIGKVTDQPTGQTIAGARVTVISGGNGYQATTDANGSFRIPCVRPSGVWAMAYATASGHQPGGAYLTVPMVGDSAPVTIPLARRSGPTAVKMRLTWGAVPFDLDAHLSGPQGAGRFHVSFNDPVPVPYADLDGDDMSSFGPEVITIREAAGGQLVPGDYHYWVDNFGHGWQTNPEPNTYAGSMATVTVLAIDAAGLPMQLGSYDVANATGSPADDLWHVVDLTIDASGNVTLHAVQTLQPGVWSDVL